MKRNTQTQNTRNQKSSLSFRDRMFLAADPHADETQEFLAAPLSDLEISKLVRGR